MNFIIPFRMLREAKIPPLLSQLGDNGSMSFWDWKTGHRFQSLDTTAQPGSLDAEAGLMSSIYDKTGLRLICGEADETSKPSSFFIF